MPCPSFPCFIGKTKGKTPQKQGFFYPHRTPQKEETVKNQVIHLERQNSKEISKKQRKEGQGVYPSSV